MELYKEMYLKLIKDSKASLSSESIADIIKDECYQALCQIKDILRKPEYDDDACFDKIEEIVCLFEKLGSTGGSRHDFG